MPVDGLPSPLLQDSESHARPARTLPAFTHSFSSSFNRWCKAVPGATEHPRQASAPRPPRADGKNTSVTTQWQQCRDKGGVSPGWGGAAGDTCRSTAQGDSEERQKKLACLTISRGLSHLCTSCYELITFLIVSKFLSGRKDIAS